MFDFLKKKIASWIKKPQKEKKKTAVSPKKKGKKEKSKKNILTKEEKENLESAELLIKEAEISPETPKPLEESEETEAKGNFFTKLIKKITTSNLTSEQFDEAFQDLEVTLLENNVALEAVDAIKNSLSEQLVGQKMKKTEAPARILESLKESILSLLIEPPDILNQIKEHNRRTDSPFVIVFFGINGTGKTTSIAKLASFLKKNNITSVIAAADTFRAASIEQLKIHSEKLKIPLISQNYNSDPAAVAFDAIQYAKKSHINAVLIDTAGRMYTKVNLIKEMEKIIRISKPDLKFFVGESITGNDALEQAKIFNESIGIDGIILSKADMDEKAGTILSVSHITKKPIYFLGIGQDYDDLLPFTKKAVLKNLGLE